MYCLSDICTLCLVPNTNLKSILSQDTDGTVVEEKLKVFLLELIHYQPNIPKYICSHCLLYLNYVYKFRLRCLENFTKFNKYVQKLEAHGPYTNLSVTITDTISSKNISMNIINSQESSIDADVVVKQEYEHVSNNFQTPYDVFQEFNEEKHIIDDNINITSVSDESNLVGNGNSDLVESFEDNGSEDKYLPSNTSPLTAPKRLAPSRTSSRRSASKADKSDSTDEQHSFGGGDSDLEPFEDNESDDEYLPSLPSNDSSTASEASNSDLELIEIRSPSSSTLAMPKGTNSNVTKYTSEYFSTSNTRIRSTEENSYKSSERGGKGQSIDLIIDTQTNTSRQECDEYGEGFNQTSKLIRHKRIIHNDLKPFKCKAFSDVTNFRAHKRLHTGQEPHKCDICGKAFNQSSSLVSHVRTHTGEKPHKCDICGKAFCQSSSLVSHVRTHTGEKPHKCDICGKAFNQSSSLVSHVRTHTGEKPHKCDICGKAFCQSGSLFSHVRTHTGEKPYKCDICGKAFNQSSSLVSHVRTHTGEKPYKCDICGEAFSNSNTLNRHKRIHTAEKPHKCDICGKAFRQATNLVRHKRTHK